MIDIPLPPDIETKYEWLRELYPHTMLMGELIHLGDAMFGAPEFAKPIQDQVEELAQLQFCACIQTLYTKEKEAIEIKFI